MKRRGNSIAEAIEGKKGKCNLIKKVLVKLISAIYTARDVC